MNKLNLHILTLCILLLTNKINAQIQCCCEEVGCFNGNAGFNCDDWCVLIGLGINIGSNTPYSNPAECTAGCPFLPVELSYFNARSVSNGILLEWETLSEINNEGFEIQRMRGIEFNWEVLGFVRGVGESIENLRYSFLDQNETSGINYYRLKQIDYDGDFSFSPTKVVETIDNQKVSLWPTLARDHILIQLNDNLNVNSYQIKIINMMGEMVLTKNDSPIHLEISSLESGQYIVNIFTNDENYIRRFVKIK